MNEEIIKLFKRDFDAPNYLERGSRAKFACPCYDKCRVDEKKEPIWTSALGDEGTDVMVVAEAPSNTEGSGPHIGGRFADWPIGKKSRPDALREFVRKYYKTIPYFADIIKCGVSKQTREEKEIFKIRTANCMKRYLLREIEIIRPKTILCVGKRSYEAIKEIKENSGIGKSAEIIPLVHYSNQAGLQLSIADKEDYLWPYQVGKIQRRELSKLSCFSKRVLLDED